jgi:hypothetical protein
VNLAEIRTRVRNRLGEPNERGRFPNAMLNDWINDAEREFAIETECVIGAATTNVVGGQHEYALPSDFLGPIKVELAYMNRPYVLSPVNFLSINPGVSLSAYHYYIRGQVLGLHPIPERTARLTLYYVQNPFPMKNDDDIPTIPGRFHHMLVPWVVYQAKLSDDGKLSEAQVAYVEWMENLRLAKEQLERQKSDKYMVLPDPWEEY